MATKTQLKQWEQKLDSLEETIRDLMTEQYDILKEMEEANNKEQFEDWERYKLWMEELIEYLDIDEIG